MNLQDCFEEVIAKGPGFVIHSSERVGAHRTSDWDPAALLEDIRFESPLVLTDHAWTDWMLLTDGTLSCSIIYGIRGLSSGQRAIPGYGILHVYTTGHVQRPARVEVLPLTEFRFGR